MTDTTPGNLAPDASDLPGQHGDVVDAESPEPVVDEEATDSHLVAILLDVVKQLSIARDGYDGVEAILAYPDGVPWEYHTAAVMAGYLLADSAGITPEQVAGIVAAMREQDHTGLWCPVCESADHALADCPKAPQHQEEGSHDEQ